jgi:hypothetical protein
VGFQNLLGQHVVDGNLTLAEQDFTPPVPSAGAACRMYVKDDKFVLQWNQGGTAYYKYLDLAGTVGTWTHGTAAP